MDREALALINGVNRAIIQIRGIYSLWSGAHALTYHQLLVLYAIREHGFCTQKQLCDSYLLPKQTMHNVIAALRSDGLLRYDPVHSGGREKAFVLSPEGERRAAPLYAALDGAESRAVDLLGRERLRTLTQLLLDYSQALEQALGAPK